MKILLVYPRYPSTFWSFRYALKFISRKANLPPLGLLTVASLLPKHWQKQLIDMNASEVRDKDLLGADYVFISAMSVQFDSARTLIDRCKKLGVKMVAGGTLFTARCNEFDDVDHLILNEAEITLPMFLKDLENGCAKHIYTTSDFADIRKTPTPQWNLFNQKDYAIACVQYSRGCPFNCDFCDVTLLFGQKFRTKTKNQFIGELESLYMSGWKGRVFVVDDNFIGNKKELKNEILPAMIEWLKLRRYPFSFSTQASVNLADDEELINLMVEAGFDQVFVGIETPDDKSLIECGKLQNKGRDLIACVQKIQGLGLQVQGGFILGFDSDNDSVFERMISFIQKSGIATAMVGILNAPKNTRLYERLKKENRLIKNMSGDNTDNSLNFVPKMNPQKLVEGYKKVMKTIYSHKNYYERVKTFLKNFKPLTKKDKSQFHLFYLGAFVKSIWVLGIKNNGRIYYWKLFFWTLFTRPKLFPRAITYAIYGFHFRKSLKGN